MTGQTTSRPASDGTGSETTAYALHGSTTLSASQRFALDLAEQGIPTFAFQKVTRYDRSGLHVDKVPAEKWTREATTDVARILARGPWLHCGVPTGRRSGYVGIDVDGDRGRAALQAIGLDVTAYPSVPTQRADRGTHYLAAMPLDGEPVPCSAGDGLDVRGNGGWLAVWNPWPDMSDCPPLSPEIALWARTRSGRTSSGRGEPASYAGPPALAWGTAVVRNACSELAETVEGGRNAVLAKTAFVVFEVVNGRHVAEDEAVASLWAAARATGLDEAEIGYTLDRARERVAGQARGPKDRRPARLTLTAAAGRMARSRMPWTAALAELRAMNAAFAEPMPADDFERNFA